MYYDKYDSPGWNRAEARLQQSMGEEFYKLSDKKREELVAIEYLAQLLVEIYLDGKAKDH